MSTLLTFRLVINAVASSAPHDLAPVSAKPLSLSRGCGPLSGVMVAPPLEEEQCNRVPASLSHLRDERRPCRWLPVLVQSGTVLEASGAGTRPPLIPAASTGTAVAYAVGLYAVSLVIPGTITWLKGQRTPFFVGFLAGGIVWWIAAMRLARPASWWSQRFYDQQKLERSIHRYGSV